MQEKQNRIVLTLEEDIAETLKRLAKKDCRKISNFVQSIVESYLKFQNRKKKEK